MLPTEKGPTFDGKGSSVQAYELQVRLWMRMTKMEPATRASACVLRANSVARQVCSSADCDHLGNNGSLARMLGKLRNYFAPGAANSINQEVARPTQRRRTDRAVD